MTDTTDRAVFAGPDGRDGAAGTRDAPCSLTSAIERVGGRSGVPTTVVLLAGTYRLAEPLVLTSRHSGSSDRPVRIGAAPGARPVLSAARPVANWRRLDHTVAGLPTEAAGHLWYADVGDCAPRTLYDDEGMLERARYGPLTSDPDHNDEATPTLLYARRGDLHDWSRWAPELFILPSHVWQAQYLPIARIDAERGVVETAVAGTYSLVADGRKTPQLRYWIDNVPEGITEPGVWLHDPESGRVYLWPRNEPSSPDGPAAIVCPLGIELLRVDSEDGTPAHDIEIAGLRFAHGDRAGWPADRRAPQHDWQVYGWADAMVRLCGARDVTIRDCEFVAAGATGVRLDGFAVGNVVEQCEFDGLGGNAVALVGDEPGRPEHVHHNAIRRCRIRDTGRLWWQASGIIVVQSGYNAIADNHLSSLPYGAVTLVSGREAAFHETPLEDGRNGNVVSPHSFGESPRDFMFVVGHLACRNNVVEHNEIRDVMQRLGDGNAIYISGTGWGNVIRGNYVHDIPAAGVHSGIRTDDRQWYTLVERNVICRVNGGGLTLKDVNDLVDNVIVDCESPAAVLIRRSPAWGANIKRNVIVAHRAAEPPAPFFGGGGFGGRIEEPNIDENLLWSAPDGESARACQEELKRRGLNLNGIAADPGFLDAGADDYRLTADSPARALGIRSLDRWGVRPAGGTPPRDGPGR